MSNERYSDTETSGSGIDDMEIEAEGIQVPNMMTIMQTMAEQIAHTHDMVKDLWEAVQEMEEDEAEEWVEVSATLPNGQMPTAVFETASVVEGRRLACELWGVEWGDLTNVKITTSEGA